MLFPEKLDMEKKGRPSTAGSKIKVGVGGMRPVLSFPCPCPPIAEPLPLPLASPMQQGLLPPLGLGSLDQLP